MPSTAAAAIADEVRRYGEEILETGGFLLGPKGSQEITVLAFAGQIGILRSWGLFQVHELALDRLFGFADDRGLSIPAQFHSHMLRDELSPTDREHGLRVEEFISAVVPEYRMPPCDPAKWGWWRFDRDQWVRIGAATTGPGGVEIVEFDRGGVRAR